MPPTLIDILRRWQRHDLRHRLGESSIRGLCWAALTLALLPRPIWAAAGVLALLGEAAWTWRRWRSPQQLAEAVDAAADTHGLLHTALAAEHERAWGAPDLIALVQSQARATAPDLTEHAIRRLRLPRAPLAIGLIAALVLLLPVQTEAGPVLTRLEATLSEAPSEDEPPEDAVEPSPQQRSTLGDGEGSLADGAAQAWAERGEGEAGKTGTAGDASSDGQARQGAEGVGESAQADATPSGNSSNSSAESESPTDDKALSGRGSSRSSTTDNTEVEELELQANNLEEGTVRSGDRIASNTASDTGGSDAVQDFNPERLDEEYDDQDNAVGSGTMLDEDASALTQDIEESATNTVGLAMAGQGGINDAPGTVNLSEAPESSEVETTEEWIAARWRASSAGTLQTIDGGQSGGQSNQAWVELYTDYAALAEARMHQEEIPPGRRGYVSAYFESIRSEQ